MAVKSKGKRKPKDEVLNYTKSYFKKLAEQQKESDREYGIVEFKYKDLEEASQKTTRIEKPLTKPQVMTMMTWLEIHGYIERLKVGRSYHASIWDVRKLLQATAFVPSPEASKQEPASEGQTEESPKFEVSVVKEVENPKDNTEILAQLNTTMSNMVQYLQALPNEMTSELKSISKDLTLADHDVILNLTKEKEDLKDEVSRLKEQLEKASATPAYSEHYIYRQRNLILDEVQRMLHAPAWSVKQNKEHYQQSIVEKLDNIMDHLNIKQKTTN